MAVKRKNISNKTRFEIFKRDNFICQYCGSHPPQSILHIDHIHPIKHGGDNSQDNLITACNVCNSGKSAELLSNIPKSLKEKAIDTNEREAQIKGYSDIMQSKRDRIYEQAWLIAAELDGAYATTIPKNFLTSIKRFIESIGFDEVLEAAEIASYKNCRTKVDTFKYFCGICHNKARGD